MDILEHFLKDHILASHGISLALAVILARFDHIIGFLLKIFTKEQINGVIDKIASWFKKRVEQDAEQQQPKP